MSDLLLLETHSGFEFYLFVDGERTDLTRRNCSLDDIMDALVRFPDRQRNLTTSPQTLARFLALAESHPKDVVSPPSVKGVFHTGIDLEEEEWGSI